VVDEKIDDQPDEDVDELPVSTTQNQETKLILSSNLFSFSVFLERKINPIRWSSSTKL